MKLKILILMCALLMADNIFAASFEKDTIKARNGKDIIITFIKHSSLVLTYDGHQIQIDPVSEYADYSKFPKADILIVTHEHGDHFDKKAIAELEKPGTILITNQSVHDKLGKGTIMRNGDTAEPASYIKLEAVPAYNITPDRIKYHPKDRDNGFIITLGGTRIYIAGDTEDIPEIKNLKNIDIAFLPVNQPYTMTVDQAVNAVHMFSPAVLYPYHYNDTNVQLIADRLKASKTEVRIRQMQ